MRQSIKNLFLSMIALTFCFVTLNAQTINGRSVTAVNYTGSETGSFEQLSSDTWAEYKKGSARIHATFKEYARDEWSVYMTKTDGAKIQIDLHTKEIYYNRNFLYKVARPFVRPIAKVKGNNVTAVDYTGTEKGAFVQTGPKTWTEYKKGSTRTHATFKEYARDEWSVYMTKTDGAKIQIDLHTKKIYYNRHFLYNVSVASAKRVKFKLSKKELDKVARQ